MTNCAFVIGSPIAHSRSPLIHRYWLKKLGVNGRYEPVEVLPEDLSDFVTRIRHGEFIGGNVTIPHKEKIATLCDLVDADARLIGAVNTLIMQDDILKGSNTDMAGFLANLDQRAPGWDTEKTNAIVLGAGGAARAILIGLARRGYENIHILNRTPDRAEALANELPGPFVGHGLEAFDDLAPTANLVVNTSSVGMHGTRFETISLAVLPKTAIVTDIVYTPLRTPLLAEARALGLRTVDGLGMLLHQAVPGFAAWFGTTPKVTPELRAMIEKNLGDN